jgi:GT2 family glycosyltransferase
VSSVSATGVCAVVVTHDRRELLRESLHAVTAQTRRPDALLVVDNASTDGSAELVRREFPQAELMALERNEGSAGGFHEGMKWGLERSYGWVWVMDGDTIPTPTALERLLAALDELGDLPVPMLLASKVLWTDGRTDEQRLHPQNIVRWTQNDPDVFVAGLERGLVPVRHVTFASVLFSREALVKHGFPLKHWFMWSDDIEFTARILRDDPGYFVPASVAYHKSPTPHTPWHGGDRFYYAVRNGLFMLRSDALRPLERVRHVYVLADQIHRYLRHERYRPSSLRLVARGFRHGLLRRAV